MVYEFDGTKYEKLQDMQAARRAKHPDLARGGMNFTQAGHAVGVSKRTGKAWRNGRTRPTGRNEQPLSDRYRGGMDKPKRIDAGHLRMDERITIADLHRAGSGVRAIAQTPDGAPSTNENTNDLPRQYSPPREPTRPDTPRNTSTQSPRNPTTGPARHWTS